MSASGKLVATCQHTHATMSIPLGLAFTKLENTAQNSDGFSLAFFSNVCACARTIRTMLGSRTVAHHHHQNHFCRQQTIDDGLGTITSDLEEVRTPLGNHESAPEH